MRLGGFGKFGGDGGVRVPLRRDGPFSKGPYDGGLGVSGTATVLRDGVAPLCLRRSGMTGWVRGTLRVASGYDRVPALRERRWGWACR